MKENKIIENFREIKTNGDYKSLRRTLNLIEYEELILLRFEDRDKQLLYTLISSYAIRCQEEETPHDNSIFLQGLIDTNPRLFFLVAFRMYCEQDLDIHKIVSKLDYSRNTVSKKLYYELEKSHNCPLVNDDGKVTIEHINSMSSFTSLLIYSMKNYFDGDFPTVDFLIKFSEEFNSEIKTKYKGILKYRDYLSFVKYFDDVFSQGETIISKHEYLYYIFPAIFNDI